MADAIVKVSWRRSPEGRVAPGPAQGGIAGTCFTLESGMTLTAFDTMAGIFTPNPGFDACRVFVAERSGQVTEIFESAVEAFPAHNTALLARFSSGTRHPLSRTTGPVNSCSLVGYRAHEAPFTTRLSAGGTAVEVVDPRMSKATQDYHGLVPRPYIFDVTAADMAIRGKAGFIVDVRAGVGLAGAPMLDEKGAAMGICILGFPADAAEKSWIGAIDLRPFLLG
jgi:hypothetical protein